MFAPLLDRMITRDLSRRFTAREALEFLEGFASELTEEQLQLPEPFLVRRGICYENYDRWKRVSEEFIKNWGHFREPKLSFQIRLLRKICDYHWGYIAIQWARRIIRFQIGKFFPFHFFCTL